MPSSTSSSERLTASDRPGVAQPVPVRDIPAQPWGGIAIAALLMTALLTGGWEWYWRDFGSVPSYRNSDGLWARERRRIDQGEGRATVLIGSSRILFDIDLDTWERVSGERPIQLAVEGTTPMIMLEDLAADPDFHGRLLVGVAPDIFFSGWAARREILKFYQDQSPSQRAGQWLSMHLIEPWLAFYEPDFALATVVRRQDWPPRPGLASGTRVRKLALGAADRDTRMWSKVETDPEYRALARRIWAEDFGPLDPEKRAELDQAIAAEIGKAVAAVAKLRARGIAVLFVRPPSDSEYLAYENRELPRASTWDLLLQKTGAPGIHFEDYPELQGYELPEWSHLAAAERPRFTEALYRIVARSDWGRKPHPVQRCDLTGC